jgi:geranylgeranyl diphosphate synthase, type III
MESVPLDSNDLCHCKDETILEPYQYLSKIPGKDVRGILLDAFQVWLQIPNDKIERIKMIISSLHNARYTFPPLTIPSLFVTLPSLLIDDIEDNSKMRRGVPVAQSICL